MHLSFLKIISWRTFANQLLRARLLRSQLIPGSSSMNGRAWHNSVDGGCLYVTFSRAVTCRKRRAGYRKHGFTRWRDRESHGLIWDGT
jgi:hypothetical protein